MVSATSAILVPLGSVPETRLIIFPKQCAVVYKLEDEKELNDPTFSICSGKRVQGQRRPPRCR